MYKNAVLKEKGNKYYYVPRELVDKTIMRNKIIVPNITEVKRMI